jgi:hypothetical protein
MTALLSALISNTAPDNTRRSVALQRSYRLTTSTHILNDVHATSRNLQHFCTRSYKTNPIGWVVMDELGVISAIIANECIQHWSGKLSCPS